MILSSCCLIRLNTSLHIQAACGSCPKTRFYCSDEVLSAFGRDCQCREEDLVNPASKALVTRVTSSTEFRVRKLPVAAAFVNAKPARLSIIGGKFDASANSAAYKRRNSRGMER